MYIYIYKQLIINIKICIRNKLNNRGGGGGGGYGGDGRG